MATLSATGLTKAFSGRTVVKGVNLQLTSGEENDLVEFLKTLTGEPPKAATLNSP